LFQKPFKQHNKENLVIIHEKAFSQPLYYHCNLQKIFCEGYWN